MGDELERRRNLKLFEAALEREMAEGLPIEQRCAMLSILVRSMQEMLRQQEGRIIALEAWRKAEADRWMVEAGIIGPPDVADLDLPELAPK